MHGVPRATFDLDILIEATPDNTQRLLAALLEAGLGTAALTDAKEILANEITIFKDQVRLDVQTSSPGLVFSEAWQNKKTVSYEGQKFFILAKRDLIASKKAAGRDIDLADVRMLEAADTDEE